MAMDNSNSFNTLTQAHPGRSVADYRTLQTLLTTAVTSISKKPYLKATSPLSTPSSSFPSSPPSSKLSAIPSNSLLMPLKERTPLKNVGVILTFDTAGVLASVGNCIGSSGLCVSGAFCRLGIYIWRLPFPLFPDHGIIATCY
ncbi:hypothetical protein L211DRAFT_871499 [Terfezia boudieri ATCC MYA-4762]|uniref:Uncharacterized protein n=1 Tax=Terfezia boudieri ATCC MYA-4762 TaxID=1051890 RepID=A0A3N4L8W1_9PEZI|nr:hypothetical protein L211DRAFT_871496 [Terfezia boudieri ATCC MYA-4762]RPB19046.1 hypothetical protein L211DRAFT_871499 [Terfezia boudieri ATCC MYA-4762]